MPGRLLVHGQSITDGCIGWDTTVEVLETLARAVTSRRRIVRQVRREFCVVGS